MGVVNFFFRLKWNLNPSSVPELTHSHSDDVARLRLPTKEEKELFYISSRPKSSDCSHCGRKNIPEIDLDR